MGERGVESQFSQEEFKKISSETEKITSDVGKEAEEEFLPKEKERISTEELKEKYLNKEMERENISEDDKKFLNYLLVSGKDIGLPIIYDGTGINKAPELVRLKFKESLLRPKAEKIIAEILRDNFKNRDELITQQPYNIEKPGEEIQEGQRIGWEQIVFVRATDHLPRIRNEKLIEETVFTGTKGKIIRTTQHWALNHLVHDVPFESHSWKENSVVIIAPGIGMVRENDKPINLYHVDSFWNKDIYLPEGTRIIIRNGQKLKLPEKLKNKIEIINIDKKEDINELTNNTIKSMGYTQSRGFEYDPSYLGRQFEGGIKYLALMNNLSNKRHEAHILESFEESIIDWLPDDALGKFKELPEKEKMIVLGEVTRVLRTKDVKELLYEYIGKLELTKKLNKDPKKEEELYPYINDAKEKIKNPENAEEEFKESKDHMIHWLIDNPNQLKIVEDWLKGNLEILKEIEKAKIQKIREKLGVEKSK